MLKVHSDFYEKNMAYSKTIHKTTVKFTSTTNTKPNILTTVCCTLLERSHHLFDLNLFYNKLYT